MKRFVVLLLSLLALDTLLILHSEQGQAAACCGGGFAVPSIISGDDRAQFTGSYGLSEVVVDNVDSSGFWHPSNVRQKVQTLRLEGAHLIADRWQVGASLPVLSRSRLAETHSGLGDVSASLAYEYLTDWDYHPYRPKAIGFVQAVLPTGRSRAESEHGGLDSRGNGYPALGIGTLLTKTFGRWDSVASLEVHRSFPKSFESSLASGRLIPGFGGTAMVGGGYNTENFRFGSSLMWSYEDRVAIEGPIATAGFLERFATLNVSLSYLSSDEMATTLAYTDQTLFGDPLNTSLGRGFLLMLQRRWPR